MSLESGWKSLLVMGLFGTMSAIDTVLGPSLGSVLIAGFGWRAIFLVNVPLGILTFLLAHHYLPIDRRGLWRRAMIQLNVTRVSGETASLTGTYKAP